MKKKGVKKITRSNKAQKEIQLMVKKKLSTKQCPRPNGVIDDFNKMYKSGAGEMQLRIYTFNAEQLKIKTGQRTKRE